MISSIGALFLIISLFWSIYYYYQVFIMNSYSISYYYFISCYFFFVTVSFFSLVGAHLFLDNSTINVLVNTFSMQPIFYKVASSWGNHEGSMLLWLWVMSFVYFSFSVKEKKNIRNFRYIYQSSYEQVSCVLCIFFSFYVLITSNPFEKIDFRQIEGQELTPVLQDVILCIHPPIIYLGYIFLAIPFCFSFLKNSSLESLELLNMDSRKYFILSWFFLTLGIGLGSWWAYYELGWGGWWFWDPVENASLLPWIISTCFLHLSGSRAKTKNINILLLKHLCFLGFISSVLGTFFVRSGLLESVHSFASDSSRGLLILLFIMISLLFYLRSVCRMNVTQKEKNFSEFLDSIFFFPKIVYIQFFFFFVFLLIVLFGTIYPVLLSYFGGNDVSQITIGPEFYKESISLFLWPFLIFLGVSSNLNGNFCTARGIIFSACLLYCLHFKLNTYEANIYELVTIFLSLSSIYIIIESYVIRRQSVSMLLSHFSVNFFVLSCFLWSKMSFEMHKVLFPGDTVYISKISKILFKGVSYVRGPNYECLQGNFSIFNDQNVIGAAFPEKRHYFQKDFYTTKVDIISNCYKDIQIILGDGNLYTGWCTSIYSYPCMNFIWMSVLFLLISGIILYKRNS